MSIDDARVDLFLVIQEYREHIPQYIHVCCIKFLLKRKNFGPSRICTD